MPFTSGADADGPERTKNVHARAKTMASATRVTAKLGGLRLTRAERTSRLIRFGGVATGVTPPRCRCRDGAGVSPAISSDRPPHTKNRGSNSRVKPSLRETKKVSAAISRATRSAVSQRGDMDLACPVARARTAAAVLPSPRARTDNDDRPHGPVLEEPCCHAGRSPPFSFCCVALVAGAAVRPPSARAATRDELMKTSLLALQCAVEKNGSARM